MSANIPTPTDIIKDVTHYATPEHGQKLYMLPDPDDECFLQYVIGGPALVDVPRAHPNTTTSPETTHPDVTELYKQAERVYRAHERSADSEGIVRFYAAEDRPLHSIQALDHKGVAHSSVAAEGLARMTRSLRLWVAPWNAKPMYVLTFGRDETRRVFYVTHEDEKQSPTTRVTGITQEIIRYEGIKPEGPIVRLLNPTELEREVSAILTTDALKRPQRFMRRLFRREVAAVESSDEVSSLSTPDAEAMEVAQVARDALYDAMRVAGHRDLIDVGDAGFTRRRAQSGTAIMRGEHSVNN